MSEQYTMFITWARSGKCLTWMDPTIFVRSVTWGKLKYWFKCLFYIYICFEEKVKVALSSGINSVIKFFFFNGRYGCFWEKYAGRMASYWGPLNVRNATSADLIIYSKVWQSLNIEKLYAFSLHQGHTPNGVPSGEWKVPSGRPRHILFVPSTLTVRVVYSLMI